MGHGPEVSGDDWRLRTALDALEAVPPARLRLLADWLDTLPGYCGAEVQADLRRMASLSEQALDAA